MSDNLTRYTTEDMRVYTDEEDLYLPSVTSVLDELPEPEGLKYWRKKNDGKDGRKHWRDILSYKSNRGTMIHYKLLNEFAPSDMFGQNEEDSSSELKLNGNWKRYQDELVFAEDAWEEIKREVGIDDGRVLDVECFVTNVTVGYAGQFDLLYIDDDFNLTLADLKTSKSVYDKHIMQTVAYENALPMKIDQLQVIRIHPDSESWEIVNANEWLSKPFTKFDSRDEVWQEFRGLREGMGDIGEELREIEQEGIQD